MNRHEKRMLPFGTPRAEFVAMRGGFHFQTSTWRSPTSLLAGLGRILVARAEGAVSDAFQVRTVDGSPASLFLAVVNHRVCLGDGVGGRTERREFTRSRGINFVTEGEGREMPAPCLQSAPRFLVSTSWP